MRRTTFDDLFSVSQIQEGEKRKLQDENDMLRKTMQRMVDAHGEEVEGLHDLIEVLTEQCTKLTERLEAIQAAAKQEAQRIEKEGGLAGFALRVMELTKGEMEDVQKDS